MFYRVFLGKNKIKNTSMFAIFKKNGKLLSDSRRSLLLCAIVQVKNFGRFTIPCQNHLGLIKNSNNWLVESNWRAFLGWFKLFFLWLIPCNYINAKLFEEPPIKRGLSMIVTTTDMKVIWNSPPISATKPLRTNRFNDENCRFWSLGRLESEVCDSYHWESWLHWDIFVFCCWIPDSKHLNLWSSLHEVLLS